MPPFSEGSVRDYDVALLSVDHTDPKRTKFTFAAGWAGGAESLRSGNAVQITVAVPPAPPDIGIAGQYDAAYRTAIDMLQEVARKLDVARRAQQPDPRR